ncbi:unnamed protein product [Brassicogethes aeneus]|uniref:Uncharacterized protein n=1 Tax=Brassicogethes aeneus TaxID=1431903 RepID=A0A9P0BBU8_BRAAE|nr:unnamed protein product [Brassicogethes aeneus]
MSDTSYYEPTFSEDERYEAMIKEKRRLIERNTFIKEEKRVLEFKKIETYLERLDCPALTFLEFNSLKIKFFIYPSKLNDFISERTRFFAYIRFSRRYQKWILKKYSLPMGRHKQQIFDLFYDGNKFAVTDEYILDLITNIDKIILDWAELEKKYRERKIERYRNGELCYLDMDDTDEELFLDINETKEIMVKKECVLRRMMVPENLDE